ncbi:MAG: CDP-alcohol phosphatidyltransferase family protein [Clostridia bacterium]|nr:CDP-alcohol phosphatidyltransferase family protein [Clostridia bacterium]
MKVKYLTAANCMTAFRVVGSLILLLVEPFTVTFYVLYTLCGLSDAVDGITARLTKTSSEFGAKLDSIADMLFYAVMIFKIFANLVDILPQFVWYTVATALVVRAASYVIAAVKYKRFAAVHTYMNKLTSLTIFTVPYFIFNDVAFTAVCITVCTVANIASLEELIIHLSSKSYDPKRKMILKLKNDPLKKFLN